MNTLVARLALSVCWIVLMMPSPTHAAGEPGCPQFPNEGFGEGSTFALTRADLDGDSRPEFITCDPSTAILRIFTRDGFGGFQELEHYFTVADPLCTATADFDADSHLDVAVVHENGYVTIWRNDGEGGLSEAWRYNAKQGAEWIAAGDLDGDSIPDLAITCYGSFATLLGAGNCSFGLPILTPTSPKPHRLAIGDMDGDGANDVAVTLGNYMPDDGNAVDVYWNAGNAVFGSKLRLAAGDDTRAITLADLDGDRDLDIACTNYKADTASVFHNSGQRSFSSAETYPVGHNPVSIAASDYVGDGNPDLLVANAAFLAGENTVSVLRGIGGGGFAPAEQIPSGLHSYGVFPDDVDEDGDMDLVVGHADHYGVLEVIARDDNGFQTREPILATGSTLGVAIGDLDGDGLEDIVAATDRGLSVFHGAPGRAFTSEFHLADQTTGSPRIIDIDGDGALDVLCTSRDQAAIGVAINDGRGNLLSIVSYSVRGVVITYACGDINGDSAPDLVVGTTFPSYLTTFLNTGDGTFGRKKEYPLSFGLGSLSLVDSDRDGVSSVYGLQIYGLTEYKNDGRGVLSEGAIYPLTYQGLDLMFGDVNGDTWIDAVVPEPTCSEVFLNDQHGGFAKVDGCQTDLINIQGELGRITDDRDLDVVARCTSSDGVMAIVNGNGNGTFSGLRYFHGGGSMSVADLDGDGAVDMVASGAREIQVYWNSRCATRGPLFKVASDCSVTGAIRAWWSGAASGGNVAVVIGSRAERFKVPDGTVCAGAVLGVSPPDIQILWSGTSDAHGAGSLEGRINEDACGHFLQLIDLTSCATSKVQIVR